MVLLWILVGSIAGFIWFSSMMLFLENTEIGEAISEKIVSKIKGEAKHDNNN